MGVTLAANSSTASDGGEVTICGINEGEGSASKAGGVTLAANSMTASDGGEVTIVEREVTR